MKKTIAVLLKIYKGDLNAFDEAALEAALRFPESEVTVVAMCPTTFEGTLKRLTRLGLKVILVSDAIYAGSDTIATSLVLSKALEKIHPDLIFAGKNSFDGDTGQVPLMISELLGFKTINHIIKINEEISTTRNDEVVELTNNQVVTFEKVFPLRSPSLFSKETEIEVWDNKVLGIDPKDVGFAGSPTKVIKTYENENNRRFAKFFDYSDLKNLIDSSISKKTSNNTKSVMKAPLIYYVGNIKDIAQTYGDNVKEITILDKSVSDLVTEIKNKGSSIILWEEEPNIKEMASRVAIRLKCGLCADCVDFRYENNAFVMTRPALGGNINAEIICASNVAMATVRSKSKSSDIVFSLGKGSLENLETIKKLAKEYKAKIVCSRILADTSVFPYSYQVGLTGKIIEPKVLVTFGVSGAIQHIVGISNAQTIISINKDKNAPIFDYSDYGIVMDVKDIKL